MRRGVLHELATDPGALQGGDGIGSFSADGVALTVPWSADPAEDYARKKEEACAAPSGSTGVSVPF